MDANRKRRAKRLGVDEPNAALRAMTDKELLAAFAAEHSGEAALARARAARERVDPLFAHLDDLSDAELLAEHARANAEVAAEAAELRSQHLTPLAPVRGREAATPEPVEESDADSSATEPELLPVPPIEPHPIVLQEVALPTPRPARTVQDEQNAIGLALIAGAHREAERAEAETRRLEAASAGEPMVEGSVQVAPSGTRAVRWALGARLYDP